MCCMGVVQFDCVFDCFGQQYWVLCFDQCFFGFGDCIGNVDVGECWIDYDGSFGFFKGFEV